MFFYTHTCEYIYIHVYNMLGGMFCIFEGEFNWKFIYNLIKEDKEKQKTFTKVGFDLTILYIYDARI